MRFTMVMSALAALSVSTFALPQPQDATTSQCDATKCAREIIKVLGKAAGCVIESLGRKGENPAGGIVCANIVGDLRECQPCKVEQMCDKADQKAWSNACDFGESKNGPNLCTTKKRDIINQPSETDVVVEPYVYHCANRPKVSSGITTNGGTCIIDCSQCWPCVREGLDNKPPPPE